MKGFLPDVFPYEFHTSTCKRARNTRCSAWSRLDFAAVIVPFRRSRHHKSQHNEEVKMRYAIVLLTALVAAACGEAPDTGVSPSSMLSVTGLTQTAPMGDAANSCTDSAPIWVTVNYTTSNGHLQGEWTPIFNIDTYQVQISYSRDGIEPWRVVAAFDTNRTEFRYVDRENGGRYLVRVR